MLGKVDTLSLYSTLEFWAARHHLDPGISYTTHQPNFCVEKNWGKNYIGGEKITNMWDQPHHTPAQLLRGENWGKNYIDGEKITNMWDQPHHTPAQLNFFTFAFLQQTKTKYIAGQSVTPHKPNSERHIQSSHRDTSTNLIKRFWSSENNLVKQHFVSALYLLTPL